MENISGIKGGMLKKYKKIFEDIFYKFQRRFHITSQNLEKPKEKILKEFSGTFWEILCKLYKKIGKFWKNVGRIWKKF